MMKTVRHNRKEIKHIENCTSQNAVKKQVKVNNYLFMDNQERFENVCLGYSIQAERLMNIVQQNTTGTITKDWVTPERKTAIEQSSVIMESRLQIFQTFMLFWNYTPKTGNIGTKNDESGSIYGN